MWHVVIPKFKICKRGRLNNNFVVYTAELVAILIAHSWVESNMPRNEVVIASDFSSALISIQNIMSQSRQDIVLDIVQLLNRLWNSGIKVTFLWVPAHLGVKGNELADMNAKKASELPKITMSINYSKSEIKSIVKSKSKEKWQAVWNSAC